MTEQDLVFAEYQDYSMLTNLAHVSLETCVRWVNSCICYLTFKAVLLVKHIEYKNGIGVVVYHEHKPTKFYKHSNTLFNIRNAAGAKEKMSIGFIVKTMVNNNTIAVYTDTIYTPYGNITPIQTYDFNTFAKPLFCDVPIDNAKIAVIQNLLSAICGDQANVVEYVNKWIAHIIQFPEILPKVGLIFKSDMQGIGRSMFWNQVVSPLLTKTHNTIGISDVLKKFNQHLMHQMLIITDDVPYSQRKAHSTYIWYKNLVSAPTFDYKQKYKPSVILNHTTRYVLLSNSPNVLNMHHNEKMFFIIGSNNRIHEENGFIDIDRVCKSTNFASMMYKYYNNMDLTGFDPSVYPETPAQNEVNSYQLPRSQLFMIKKSLTQNLSIVSKNDLYTEFLAWCVAGGYQKQHQVDFEFDIFDFQISDDSDNYDLGNLEQCIRNTISNQLYEYNI